MYLLWKTNLWHKTNIYSDLGTKSNIALPAGVQGGALACLILGINISERSQASNHNFVLSWDSSECSLLMGPFSFLWHHGCKIGKIKHSQGDWGKGEVIYFIPKTHLSCNEQDPCVKLSSPVYHLLRDTTECSESCLEWNSRYRDSDSRRLWQANAQCCSADYTRAL